MNTNTTRYLRIPCCHNDSAKLSTTSDISYIQIPQNIKNVSIPKTAMLLFPRPTPVQILNTSQKESPH